MGNAQRKIEVFPQYVEKKEFEVKKIEQTKKLNRPSRKTNLFSTFNKVMICVVICLSILVMNRYSKIQSMSSELKEVKNQLFIKLFINYLFLVILNINMSFPICT